MTNENSPQGDVAERAPSITTLRAELSGVHAQSFKNGSQDKDNWDPRGSKQAVLEASRDQRSKTFPSGKLPKPPPNDADKQLERDPSLTTLRAELSGVHALSFKKGSKDEADWDPRGSKQVVLEASRDQRSKTLPSANFPKDGTEEERDPSLTTLRAELSGVHASSFKNGSQDEADWDPTGSKHKVLEASKDQHSQDLPAKPSVGWAEQSDDSLQDAIEDWDPRKSKQARLRGFQDNRREQLPSHLPGGPTPPIESPSLTTLRAELSGVHAKSFKNGKGGADWDPNGSKHDVLNASRDQRSRKLSPKKPRGWAEESDDSVVGNLTAENLKLS